MEEKQVALGQVAIIFVIPAQAGIQAVIPRAVAESMRRWMKMRRMDSATTLRSAQNDGLKCLN